MTPFARPSHSTRGFTLIEVLVAVVVLSFGLLGAVGLQASALQANREARLQSVGVQLARELAERMRANEAVAAKTAAADNPYLYSGTPPGDDSLTATTNCLTTNCDAASMARFDMAEWLNRVGNAQRGLPGARVVVCFDAAPYNSAGLPIWDCTTNATSAANGVVSIKIGWTRRSTDLSKVDSSAFEKATGTSAAGPLVVLPVIPMSAS